MINRIVNSLSFKRLQYIEREEDGSSVLPGTVRDKTVQMFVKVGLFLE